jgi:hypothetical protein
LSPSQRYGAVARLVSAWLVAALAFVAWGVARRTGRVGGGLRLAWYLLVAVALARAIHRTHRFRKELMRPPSPPKD